MRLPTAASDGTIPAAAYDQALKEIFVSDPNFNSVEVYSTVDGHKVGEASIPGPAGLGFAPDFSKLYVGTITPNVYIVDPVGLHVTGRIAVPASMLTFSPGATGATLMPVMPYPMADGSLMLGMGYTSQSSSAAVLVGVEGLVRYDAVSGAFTPANPGPSNLGADPARSLDGKYLFVYGFGVPVTNFCFTRAPRKDTSRSPRKPRTERRSWPRTRTARSSPSLITFGTSLSSTRIFKRKPNIVLLER
jgi:hypothetical protein